MKDQAYFVGLCMDAWVQSGLDPFLFMNEVGPDPGIVRDPNRVASLVLKAREQSASGKGFLVGVKESVDTSRGTSVSTGRGKPNGGFSISSANDPSSRGRFAIQPMMIVFSQQRRSLTGRNNTTYVAFNISLKNWHSCRKFMREYSCGHFSSNFLVARHHHLLLPSRVSLTTRADTTPHHQLGKFVEL